MTFSTYNNFQNLEYEKNLLVDGIYKLIMWDTAEKGVFRCFQVVAGVFLGKSMIDNTLYLIPSHKEVLNVYTLMLEDIQSIM